MKFSLTVNDSNVEGFKLNVSADNPEEMLIVKELTEKIIEKITKIEVSISKQEY